jgi:hypothetical protein
MEGLVWHTIFRHRSPSSGPEARNVVWTRRRVYLLAAMIVGFAVMIITTSPS